MSSPTGRSKPKLTPADPGSAERLAVSGLAWQFLGQLRAMKLPEPITEYCFAPPRKWRFDFAWPALRVAVEVDGGTWSGGRHVRGIGYELDCEKLNAAVLRGWRVVRFTAAMVEDGRAIATVEELLIPPPEE